MATIKPLLAKILIQVGADEPKEIGTIEIPIEISVPSTKGGSISFHAEPFKNSEAVAEQIAKKWKHFNY